MNAQRIELKGVHFTSFENFELIEIISLFSIFVACVIIIIIIIRDLAIDSIKSLVKIHLKITINPYLFIWNKIYYKYLKILYKNRSYLITC